MAKKTTKKKSVEIGREYSVIPLPFNPLALKQDTTYWQRVAASARQQVLDYAHYVHIHEILYNKWFDFGNPVHRDGVFHTHEWMSAFIKKLKGKLTMNSPIFTDPKNRKDEEPEIDEELTDFWMDNELDIMLKHVVDDVITHGFVLFYEVANEYPEYYTGHTWKIFSGMEASQIEWDEWGFPTKWEIKNQGNGVDDFIVTKDEVIFFNPFSKSFTPEPKGRDMWDNMIDYIYIKEAMKSFDQRLGNGFLTLGVPANTSSTDMTAIEGKIQHLRTEQGLVIRQDPDNPVTVDWNQTGVQSGFVDHLTKYEDSFAVAMGFPKRWVMGDQEGAMESSGKDKSQADEAIREFFSIFVPFIKKVLMWYGQISEPKEIAVLLDLKQALAEQEKAAVDQIKTQTIAAKQWATTNEKRELDGMEALSPEEEATLMPVMGGGGGFGAENGKNTSQVPPKNGEKPTPKMPKKATKKTDTYNDLSSVFRTESVRVLSEITGLSKDTISKIRSKFDNETLTHYKPLNSSIKCDSVSDSTVDFSGYILTPAELQYEDCKYPDVRSMEEIKKWFQSNTTKQFYGGINPNDSHDSPIPAEILRDDAVALAEAVTVDDNGVLVKGKLDLNEIRKRLGSNNWVEDKVAKKEPISISVGLWSHDKIVNNKRYNSNLDVRSFVLTKHPRNPNTQIRVRPMEGQK